MICWKKLAIEMIGYKQFFLSIHFLYYLTWSTNKKPNGDIRYDISIIVYINYLSALRHYNDHCIYYYLQLTFSQILLKSSEVISTSKPVPSYNFITVREYRRGNQKWTIQRNWQNRVHKTNKNKTNTKYNVCWTPQSQANTNNGNKTWRSYKQLEVKTNRTLCSYRNRTEHNNTELKT